MVLLFVVAVGLIIVANVMEGDGHYPGLIGTCLGIYFFGQGVYLLNRKDCPIELEATDAMVTTIQKTDQLGAGVEFIEVYGRKVAIQRTKGGNTELELDGKRIVFRSEAYPKDSVFIYQTQPVALYGVFPFADEFIEIHAKPVYGYDRNVLLLRSSADTEIPIQ